MSNVSGSARKISGKTSAKPPDRAKIPLDKLQFSRIIGAIGYALLDSGSLSQETQCHVAEFVGALGGGPMPKAPEKGIDAFLWLFTNAGSFSDESLVFDDGGPLVDQMLADVRAAIAFYLEKMAQEKPAVGKNRVSKAKNPSKPLLSRS